MSLILNPFCGVLIEYIPLQQGLRHNESTSFTEEVLLIEYIPLQQGLRRVNIHDTHRSWLIEYIPLQQGLRHH